MAKFVKVYQHGVCVVQYKVPDHVYITQYRHNGISSGVKTDDIINVYRSASDTTNNPMFTIYGTDRVCIVDDFEDPSPHSPSAADYTAR